MIASSTIKVETSSMSDGDFLAELRALAMQESLAAVGRFCPIRVKERFLSGFTPQKTNKAMIGDTVVAFYVLIENSDHLYLDHLYVHPAHQGKQIGTFIIKQVLAIAKDASKAVKLGALKESRANLFYQSHGFIKTHEGEFDNYYRYEHSE